MAIFIILGILLLLLAVLFALPFFGVGMIIPVLGDVIDIPLSFLFAITGIMFLMIGGLLSVITNYWWLILIGILVYVGIISFKTFVLRNKGAKRRRR